MDRGRVFKGKWFLLSLASILAVVTWSSIAGASLGWRTWFNTRSEWPVGECTVLSVDGSGDAGEDYSLLVEVRLTGEGGLGRTPVVKEAPTLYDVGNVFACATHANDNALGENKTNENSTDWWGPSDSSDTAVVYEVWPLVWLDKWRAAFVWNFWIVMAVAVVGLLMICLIYHKRMAPEHVTPGELGPYLSAKTALSAEFLQDSLLGSEEDPYEYSTIRERPPWVAAALDDTAGESMRMKRTVNGIWRPYASQKGLLVTYYRGEDIRARYTAVEESDVVGQVGATVVADLRALGATVPAWSVVRGEQSGTSAILYGLFAGSLILGLAMFSFGFIACTSSTPEHRGAEWSLVGLLLIYVSGMFTFPCVLFLQKFPPFRSVNLTCHDIKADGLQNTAAVHPKSKKARRECVTVVGVPGTLYTLVPDEGDAADVKIRFQRAWLPTSLRGGLVHGSSESVWIVTIRLPDLGLEHGETLDENLSRNQVEGEVVFHKRDASTAHDQDGSFKWSADNDGYPAEIPTAPIASDSSESEPEGF
mmetsp:Transcript_4777/g.13390  ORF Transcript_4777/g.13390 Transcript_4777/m.13390 type:complete len:534 (-) Transcript_4777:173-1774(-)